jgi:Skp family chaperone for outer membrane proteins
VKEERVRVLKSRGEEAMSSISAILPVSLSDLSSTGSGAQVSTTEIAEAINTLNHSGVTAQNILKLAADADKRNAGRERNNNKKREDLAKVYASAQRMTSSVIFGKGNGQLGSEVYNEVLARTKNTKNKILESKRKKNRKLAERQKEVKAIRQKLKQKREQAQCAQSKGSKNAVSLEEGTKRQRSLNTQ